MLSLPAYGFIQLVESMTTLLKIIGLKCWIILLTLAGNVHSDDSVISKIASYPMPTMGGKQFWADESFFHKWRIQRNVFTGHCRLLDENDKRHAWGSLNECREVLEQIKRERHLPPMQGKAVIILHGLFRSRNSMQSMSEYLEEQGGYQVFNVSYPSTQYSIDEHARSLASIINHLDGVEEINFVGHSMGNIVIRYFLNDLQRQFFSTNSQGAASAPIKSKQPKFHRFVMLAPPNHEAQMATFFADNIFFKTLTGESGQELGQNWDRLEKNLATPQFEFAIIAGGKNDKKGFNPFLNGDNDGTISVETTKLSGACDFTVLPVMHPFIMDNAQVQQYTLRFLQKGCFITEAQRHQLAKEP